MQETPTTGLTAAAAGVPAGMRGAPAAGSRPVLGGAAAGAREALTVGFREMPSEPFLSLGGGAPQLRAGGKVPGGGWVSGTALEADGRRGGRVSGTALEADGRVAEGA